MSAAISSSITRRVTGAGRWRRIVAQLGVEEYYIYDPTSEYLNPPLAGFQLMGGRYEPMQPQHEEVRLGDMAFVAGAGEGPEYVSPLLGLRLVLEEDRRLSFYNEATGERLLNDAEARAWAEMLARNAAAQAIQAEERAAKVEAENAALREELARLRAAA